MKVGSMGILWVEFKIHIKNINKKIRKMIEMNDLRKKLKIPDDALKVINDFLLDEKNPLINDLLDIVDKYGGIEEINRKAEEASKVENLLEKLKKKKPEYVKDIEWLISQRDNNSFISIADYRKRILGDKAS
ncbi:unnamed protein product, partial [marine sediment metagenome]